MNYGFIPQRLGSLTREYVESDRSQGSMSGTAAANIELKLTIARKAAAVMRSEQFRDIFPEQYVCEWERDIEVELRTQGWPGRRRWFWRKMLGRMARVTNRVTSALSASHAKDSR